MSAQTARAIRQAQGLEASRALQHVLYRSAKQDPKRRFHTLYGHVARSDILRRAWDDVRTNRGAPGVDGQAIAQIEESGVGAFLDELAAALKAGSYCPERLRRVHIPKPGQPGKTRPLGIPTVRDRVVMVAAKIVLEPVFEADFLPVSYGFRPKRSAQMAVEAIRVEANRGAEWVLDADVADCFGSIDHEALMALVARRVADRSMLKLIRAWLRAGVMEDGVVTDTDAGTPQGSPISPLLANIALHVMDKEWSTGSRRLGVLIRYADDFVILCRSRRQAEEACRKTEQVLRGLGLQLSPVKTRIACLTQGAEGFDFLGFHHRKVESWKWRGRYYLQRWPSAGAMGALRMKVREATERRHTGEPVEVVVARLNPILRGWGAYFRDGNSARKFAAIDNYVRERIALLMSKKHGQSGRNWGRRYNTAYFSRLGIYRLSGTVRYGPTHA